MHDKNLEKFQFWYRNGILNTKTCTKPISLIENYQNFNPIFTIFRTILQYVNVKFSAEKFFTYRQGRSHEDPPHCETVYDFSLKNSTQNRFVSLLRNIS